ncbi:hypothetical protein EB74_33575 [Mycobacterium sp. SWH-M5]|nr:hypothetical protein EB74_33575 [Mycobacterium sp. SWH-M5]
MTHRRTTPRRPGDTPRPHAERTPTAWTGPPIPTLNPLLARADPRGLLHRVDTQRITSRRLMQRLRSPKLPQPPRSPTLSTDRNQVTSGGPPDVRPTGYSKPALPGLGQDDASSARYTGCLPRWHAEAPSCDGDVEDDAPDCRW